MFFSVLLSCLVINGLTIICSGHPGVEGSDLLSVDDMKKNRNVSDLEDDRLPAFFDARVKWSNICPLIGDVSNQGTCKSGWAIAISSVISDRICIRSSGNNGMPLSAIMLLSCCPNCCGCHGGNVLNAWRYVRDVGLVSGTMNSQLKTLQPEDGCQPYLKIKPLRKSNLKLSSTQFIQTPLCETKCTNPNLKLGDDHLIRTKISGFKLFSRKDPQKIMRDVIQNGPLQVSFRLFNDFRNYNFIGQKCSIYYQTWGKNEGAHAAKLIGWGTLNKVKYWHLINSFGTNWGCNGTFLIPRKDLDFIYAMVAPTFENISSKSISVSMQWTLVCLMCSKLISKILRP